MYMYMCVCIYYRSYVCIYIWTAGLCFPLQPSAGLWLPRWCQLGRCAPLGFVRFKPSVPLAPHGWVTVAAAAARSRG